MEEALVRPVAAAGQPSHGELETFSKAAELTAHNYSEA